MLASRIFAGTTPGSRRLTNVPWTWGTRPDWHETRVWIPDIFAVSHFRIFANFFSPFSIFVLRGQKKQQQNKKALVSDWRFGPGLEVEGQFGVCVPLFSASGFVALFRVVGSSIGTLHIHTHTYKEHQKIDLGRYCPPLDSLLLLLLLFRLFSNQRDYPYIAYIFIDRKKRGRGF